MLPLQMTRSRFRRAAILTAAILLSACDAGDTTTGADNSSSSFSGGSEATWSWNGLTWSQIATTYPGNDRLNFVYWKEFGGLLARDAANWTASRFDGRSWVADGSFPPPPPASAGDMFAPQTILDSSTGQLISIDAQTKTISTFVNGAWIASLASSQWPFGFSASVAGYDALRKQIVLLAWKDSTSTTADVWTLSNGRLKHLSSTIPIAETDSWQAEADDNGHILILEQTSGFSWDGTTWSAVRAGYCPTTSTQLGQQSFAYDSSHKYWVAVASTSDGAMHTWRMDGGHWTELRPASSPSGGLTSLVYDPELSGLILATWHISDCCLFDCGV